LRGLNILRRLVDLRVLRRLVGLRGLRVPRRLVGLRGLLSYRVGGGFRPHAQLHLSIGW